MPPADAPGGHRALRERLNRCRHGSGRGAERGHYESYFLRANAPGRPLAFWIRYTIFAPRGAPDQAEGELWAVVFDGERQEIHVGKEVAALADCRFGGPELDVEVAGATLRDGVLEGRVSGDGVPIQWSLRHDAPHPPLLLLPEPYYERGFPKAKALVGAPGAQFDGTLRLGDREVEVKGWTGSQNHNWGPQHTDHYAWGQVSGFDGEGADVFLECAMPRFKVGPVWTPFLPVVVVRSDEGEFAFNTIAQALRNRGALEGLEWSFYARRGDAAVQGHFQAPPEAFVGLRYRNPGGTDKVCLNSKLASCRLRLTVGGRTRELETRDRGAFEILDDVGRPEIPVRA